jgi:hypothetical protein
MDDPEKTFDQGSINLFFRSPRLGIYARNPSVYSLCTRHRCPNHSEDSLKEEFNAGIIVNPFPASLSPQTRTKSKHHHQEGLSLDLV